MKPEVELVDTLTGIVGDVLQPDECRAIAQAVRDVAMAVRDHERGYVDRHEIGEAEDWLMELIGKAICNASMQCAATENDHMSDYSCRPNPGAPGWERKSVLHETLTSVLGSTTEFARAVCNVLDGLGNDELERTSTQALAERILAEHDRILKGEQAPVAP
jgi:hypothetical protein